jgi:hypothetical protein
MAIAQRLSIAGSVTATLDIQPRSVGYFRKCDDGDE